MIKKEKEIKEKRENNRKKMCFDIFQVGIAEIRANYLSVKKISNG